MGTSPEPAHNKRLGDAGERAAREYLEANGYTILDTNFRCPWGEVDIVAQEGDCLVFLEVRARSGSGFGRPEESITPEKEGRLIATAETYMQSRPDLPPHWRIDLVAVDVDRRGSITRIEQIRNAITDRR